MLQSLHAAGAQDLQEAYVTHATIAQALLALLCGVQGAATLAIDLNRTHATNPEWTRHARFHLVWQAASYALLSFLEVTLVLAPGPLVEQRFYLAVILASMPMLGFFAAFFSRRVYGGALFDPNGIRPVRIELLGSSLNVDMNLAAEGMALLLLIAIVALFRN